MLSRIGLFEARTQQQSLTVYRAQEKFAVVVWLHLVGTAVSGCVVGPPAYTTLLCCENTAATFMLPCHQHNHITPGGKEACRRISHVVAAARCLLCDLGSLSFGSEQVWPHTILAAVI